MVPFDTSTLDILAEFVPVAEEGDGNAVLSKQNVDVDAKLLFGAALGFGLHVTDFDHISNIYKSPRHGCTQVFEMPTAPINDMSIR